MVGTQLNHHNFIGTEHILLGLIHKREGIAAKALRHRDVSLHVRSDHDRAGTDRRARQPFEALRQLSGCMSQFRLDPVLLVVVGANSVPPWQKQGAAHHMVDNHTSDN